MRPLNGALLKFWGSATDVELFLLIVYSDMQTVMAVVILCIFYVEVYYYCIALRRKDVRHIGLNIFALSWTVLPGFGMKMTFAALQAYEMDP